MNTDKNKAVFYALVRAGLWERDVELREYGAIDFSEILRLAEEQSVVGLVTAGLEHVTDIKVPQTIVYQYIRRTLHILQRNRAMNAYVAELIERLRKADIYAILVKGQGVAQCYERPLWRSSGDVDLLLSEDCYEKAKRLLIPLAASVEQEFVFLKHIGMSISGWEVELHGTLRPRLSKRIDREVDNIMGNVFGGGKVRSWMVRSSSRDVQIFLPAPDEDVIFVFTHILHHYYQEGIGLRQICDWCRLLWTYRSEVNPQLLEIRLRKMGLLTEWRAFGTYAVEYLGMPVEAMQLCDLRLMGQDSMFSKKAKRINDFVMEVGNFGYNRMVNSSKDKMNSFVARKAISFWHRTADSFRHFATFPKNSVKIWWYMVITGFKVVRGE